MPSPLTSKHTARGPIGSSSPPAPHRPCAGLPSSTGWHELRHFYASLLIEAGESVKVVQARLGHKSATETLDTYGHLWPANEEATRSAVDRLLGAALAAEHGAPRTPVRHEPGR